MILTKLSQIKPPHLLYGIDDVRLRTTLNGLPHFVHRFAVNGELGPRGSTAPPIIYRLRFAGGRWLVVCERWLQAKAPRGLAHSKTLARGPGCQCAWARWEIGNLRFEKRPMILTKLNQIKPN